MELDAYKDILEFIPELQLTAEPLRIDCVVIKKAKDSFIKKNIAAIFREVNLLEYKSPDDYISTAGFYKVYGYACLYAFLKKIPVTSMTVSFLGSRYPKGLIKHLKETRGYTVEEKNPGIYTVGGDIFPIQIIDNRKLPIEDNFWLSCLSNDLDLMKASLFLEEESRQTKGSIIQASVDAIIRANYQVIEEAIRMRKPALSLEEYMEKTGITARIEARAEARGEAKGEAKAHKYILGLLSQGLSTDEIKHRLQDTQ